MQDINSAIRVLEKQLDQLRLARDIMQITNGKVYRTPALENSPQRPVGRPRTAMKPKVKRGMEPPGSDRIGALDVRTAILAMPGPFTYHDVVATLQRAFPDKTPRPNGISASLHYLTNGKRVLRIVSDHIRPWTYEVIRPHAGVAE